MEFIKSYSRSSLILLIILSGLLMLLVNAALYFGLDFILADPSGLSTPEDVVVLIQDNIRTFFLPGTAALFALWAFAAWAFLKGALGGAVKKSGLEERLKKPSRKAPAVDKKAREEADRRMFLHLISVFQREGRLVDFFSEDLSLYEDDQIGAAVRSIQENCKKTMDKYIKPKPVMDSAEGETVTVEEGFDPGAVKLTGEVTGEPPFKGVLRHRGWRASNPDIPRLLGSNDSKIISPAEVEITEI